MFHAGVSTHPRFAFAIGRSAGSAVQRNRARRQLREILAALASDEDLVRPGDYLVGVRQTPFTSAEARTWLTTALRGLTA